MSLSMKLREAYLGHCQSSMVEIFCQNIFTSSPIIDAWVLSTTLYSSDKNQIVLQKYIFNFTVRGEGMIDVTAGYLLP